MIGITNAIEQTIRTQDTVLLLTGTEFKDSSKNHHDISLYGSPTANNFITNSEHPGSFFINTKTAILINTAQFSSTFFSTDWTAEWWEYDTNTNASNGCSFCTICETSSGQNGLFTGASNCWASTLSSGSNWNVIGGVAVWTQVKNIWRHKAITFSNNTYKFYINGECVKTLSGQPTALNKSQPMALGMWYRDSGCNYYFVGYIHHFRLSNKVKYNSTFTPQIIYG